MLFLLYLLFFLNNYDCIFAEKLIFPKSFLKRVGFSAYQNGGSVHGRNNWNHFEEQKKLIPCGSSSSFWQEAFNDINLITHLGCNAVRFSIEWAEIEPIEGFFNEQVLAFYERYCEALLTNNILPTITLHHFTHPLWFEQKGGFENEENIVYFVRFCKKVFERLQTKVHLWYTINEPTVYSFMGYILGMHSPGKKFSFSMAGTVLKNLLKAHVFVYHELKKMPGGSQSNIGIVHQALQAQSYNSLNPFTQFIANFLNLCAAHDCVKEYLKSGSFNYRFPGICNIQDYEPKAPHSYDFIGINYYSRVVIGLTGPTCYPDEVMTDMEYPLFAQGIYKTIVDLSELGVPIYITENGIADQSDELRAQFIEEHILQVFRARQNGYNVVGYFYWTLMDNFEWDRGWTKKFGLYHVDPITMIRTLRKGASSFRDFFTLSTL